MATRKMGTRQTAGYLPPGLAEKIQSKYHNVKTVVHGQKFDSKKEAARWLELQAREQAGEIRHLRRQVSYPLMCPAPLGQPPQVVSAYVADFTYEEELAGVWQPIIEDVKAPGTRTPLYVLKAKWLRLEYDLLISEV